MRVTRTIVDYQNYVRKAFLSAYKGRKCVEYELRLKWKGIAQRLTHERYLPQKKLKGVFFY